MLTFNFIRIFKARGIDKPFRYLVKAGYSDNFATRLANNRKKQFNLIDLERLCTLFQCTPNDLLEWVPGPADKGNSKHPLAPLIRAGSDSQLLQLLSSVPIDKLANIETLIKNELEK